MLTHGYLIADMSKIVKDGKVLAATHEVEVESPYGVIKFDAKVWMKAEYAHGRLVVCDSTIRGTDEIPMGQQLPNP